MASNPLSRNFLAWSIRQKREQFGRPLSDIGDRLPIITESLSGSPGLPSP